MKYYVCPVCGYNRLEEPPDDYMICPSCGTEFGYHDSAPMPEGVHQRHLALRAHWLVTGARWWSCSDPEPAGWDGRKQLEDYVKKQREHLATDALTLESVSLGRR